jgi:hypothetical protein
MVDFQLTNAPAVRDLIKEQYDMCVPLSLGEPPRRRAEGRS